MITTTDKGKLLRAKMGLILQQPFFATLMMSKVFVEDTSIKTADINGKTIKYNPEYFDKLSPDELIGVLCHLVMHPALLHHTRRNGRDIKTWNKAADYAINPLILQAGMVLPEGFLIDDQYKDMPVEGIYTRLGEKPDPDGQPNGGNNGDDDKDSKGKGKGDDNDPGGCGSVSDAIPDYEILEQEVEAKQQLAQALQIAKQQGKLPGGFERLVEEILEPKIHWKEKLARFVTEVSVNDYSFSKPNLRYLHSGFILPGLYSEEVGIIVLMVDTSASITNEEINMFAGEMQDICSTFNARIHVIFIDIKVTHTQIIEPDDTFHLEAKGGGGTDFKPGFAYLEENDIVPKCVVYFTDGCCNSYPPEPDYPVMWAQIGGYRMKPPFGDIININ